MRRARHALRVVCNARFRVAVFALIVCGSTRLTAIDGVCHVAVVVGIPIGPFRIPFVARPAGRVDRVGASVIVFSFRVSGPLLFIFHLVSSSSNICFVGLVLCLF